MQLTRRHRFQSQDATRQGRSSSLVPGPAWLSRGDVDSRLRGPRFRLPRSSAELACATLWEVERHSLGNRLCQGSVRTGQRGFVDSQPTDRPTEPINQPTHRPTTTDRRRPTDDDRPTTDDDRPTTTDRPVQFPHAEAPIRFVEVLRDFLHSREPSTFTPGAARCAPTGDHVAGSPPAAMSGVGLLGLPSRPGRRREVRSASLRRGVLNHSG